MWPTLIRQNSVVTACYNVNGPWFHRSLHSSTCLAYTFRELLFHSTQFLRGPRHSIYHHQLQVNVASWHSTGRNIFGLVSRRNHTIFHWRPSCAQVGLQPPLSLMARSWWREGGWMDGALSLLGCRARPTWLPSSIVKWRSRVCLLSHSACGSSHAHHHHHHRLLMIVRDSGSAQRPSSPAVAYFQLGMNGALDHLQITWAQHVLMSLWSGGAPRLDFVIASRVSSSKISILCRSKSLGVSSTKCSMPASLIRRSVAGYMDGWMDVHGFHNQASTCNVIRKPQDTLEVTTKIAQFNPGSLQLQ